MKYRNLILLGLTALFLTLGLLISCGSKCEKDGSCYYHNTTYGVNKKICSSSSCAVYVAEQSVKSGSTHCNCD